MLLKASRTHSREAQFMNTYDYVSAAAVFLRNTLCAPLSRHDPRPEYWTRQPTKPGPSLRAPCVHLCHRCNSLRCSSKSYQFGTESAMRVRVRVDATSLPVKGCTVLEVRTHRSRLRDSTKGGVAIHRDTRPESRYR